MGTLKTTNIQTITGSGTLTLGTSGETLALGSGVTSNLMYPAFEAFLTSDTSMSDIAVVKVPADTEVFDTHNCYDNTTNYRFTPNVAGKYFVYVRVFVDDVASNTNNVIAYIYKNGSTLATARINFDNNPGEAASPTVTQVVDMNGSTDYLEAYGLGDFISGGGNMKGNSSTRETIFGAYRIGT